MLHLQLFLLVAITIAVQSVLANDEISDQFVDNDLESDRFSPFDAPYISGDDSVLMKRNRAQDQVKKSETVLRFGKRDRVGSDAVLRFGRGDSDAELRYGRAGGQRADPMRFGRSNAKSPTLLRFGRAGGSRADSVLRFGRARLPADTTLRFGKRSDK